jgi:hypothetical protein
MYTGDRRLRGGRDDRIADRGLRGWFAGSRLDGSRPDGGGSSCSVLDAPFSGTQPRVVVQLAVDGSLYRQGSHECVHKLVGRG